MSRKEKAFDNVEVANVEATMFKLLADNERHHADPPSAAHHKITVWQDYQHMCGRAEALTVMSQTLEAAAGRAGGRWRSSMPKRATATSMTRTGRQARLPLPMASMHGHRSCPSTTTERTG